MVQLTIKYFEAKPHQQKNMNRKLMLKNFTVPENLLLEHDKNVLDGNPYEVPHYMKGHTPKNGVIDLEYMLYIHVKEIVSNYTT